MGKWDGHPGVMVDGGITHGLGLKTEKKKQQKNRRVGQYLHLLYSLLTFLLWLLRPSFTVQTLSQAKSTFLSKLNKFKVYVSQKQKNIIKNFIWSNLIFPASK